MKDIYGHIGALLVTAVWGTTFVSSKVLLDNGIRPEEICFMRFFLAYICLATVSHRKLWAEDWKDELTMCGLGIMGGSLYFLLENTALTLSTSAEVCILVCTCPLITALLMACFYKDRQLGKRQMLGSAVAFAGMILVVLNGQLILHLNPVGDILAFSAAITWGLYSIFMRRVMERYSTDFITRKIFFYGIVTILPYICYTHRTASNPDTWYMPFVGENAPVILCNILFLGLVASFGAYMLWNWAMRRLGVVNCTNYVYLQPMVTMIAGAVILGEQITAMGLCGMAVLTLGMARALART